VTPRQPPRQGLHPPVPLKALGVLSPCRNQALLPPPPPVVYVLGMNNSLPSPGRRQASSLSLLSIIQHNWLGSWDVFLPLFESFKETIIYPSVVLPQDPPLSQAHLPSFNSVVPFFPRWKPRVATYVHRSFSALFPVLPRWTEMPDIMSFDVSSGKPVFGSCFRLLQLFNDYSINSADSRVDSIPPEPLFPDTGIPLFVVCDVNIHNLVTDPLHSFSSVRW